MAMTVSVHLKLVITNHFRRWAFMPGMFINRLELFIIPPKYFAGPKSYMLVAELFITNI